MKDRRQPSGYSLRGVLIPAAFAVLIGCAQPLDTSAPPDVRAGEDACDECKMIISEIRFAAAGVRTDGTVARFDDIGDMLDYLRDQHAPFKTTWVHDFVKTNWIQAGAAFYVVSEKIHTPMGGGIVALADRSAAEALAAKNSGVVREFKEFELHGKEKHE